MFECSSGWGLAYANAYRLTPISLTGKGCPTNDLAVAYNQMIYAKGLFFAIMLMYQLEDDMEMRYMTTDEFTCYLEAIALNFEDKRDEEMVALFYEIVRRLDEMQYTCGRAIDLLKELTND